MNSHATPHTRPTRAVIPVLAALGVTLALTTPVASASPAPAAPAPPSDPVVIQLTASNSSTCSLGTTARRNRLKVEETLIGQRRVYEVTSQDPVLGSGQTGARRLVGQLSNDACVAFAEADSLITLAGDRFHSWTGQTPSTSATESEWQAQPARSHLGLPRIHQSFRGAGSVVAVLDTGVDSSHPALAGRLGTGWNYVSGNTMTSDVACGCDTNLDGRTDGAVGHGTFVAGTVALVAPEARILPLRVLDSDGQGSVFAVTDAILDAVHADVDVINLSFGTDDDRRSPLLDEAIRTAEREGILVVAAAGNSATTVQHYPANAPGALAVTSTNVANNTLASFSNYGKWVSVAAVGEDLVGPFPGRRYVRWSGTSASTPVVAGQAALLTGAAPTATLAQVRAAIVGTTTALRGDRTIYYGRVEPAASLSRLLTANRTR